jgi:hypothetical protein
MNTMIHDKRTYMAPVEYLHLTAYSTDAGRQEFLQSDPEIAGAILSHLCPERLFVQKQLVFTGCDSVTVLPTERIEWIRLRGAQLPAEWHQAVPLAALTEISEEAFDRIRRRQWAPRRIDLDRFVSAPPAREIGMLVEMRSGAAIFLSVRPYEAAAAAGDVGWLLSDLFSRSVLFGRCSDDQDDEAIFLLNPANAVRFTLAPAPSAPVAGAWPMQMLSHHAGLQS